MSNLSIDQKSKIISALCEGLSIRSTERLLNTHRDTVMRLGVKVGEGCAALHGKLMHNVHISRIEMDEAWAFVKKKRFNVAENDPDTVGDQYIFLAMDATGKAVISWHVGKRNFRNTLTLTQDVGRRVLGNPEISTDGYAPYVRAIDEVYEGNAAHGVVDKQTVIVAKNADSGKYYAKEKLVEVARTIASGEPKKICTSYIERLNLTYRMQQRRMTRETNAFSKKYENLCAAIALYTMYYNFCRVHMTLRVTPAMQLGLADHIWSVSELVEAALSREVQDRVQFQRARFHVIDGGKSL